MNLVKELEGKISNLEAEIKKHNNYVTEISQMIEKLLADKANSSNNLNILNGAIQAYKDVINGVKSGDVSEVAKGVAEAVQDAAEIEMAFTKASNG